MIKIVIRRIMTKRITSSCKHKRERLRTTKITTKKITANIYS